MHGHTSGVVVTSEYLLTGFNSADSKDQIHIWFLEIYKKSLKLCLTPGWKYYPPPLSEATGRNKNRFGASCNLSLSFLWQWFWCVSVHYSGTKPLLWEMGLSDAGRRLLRGPAEMRKKNKILEPVQLNYKEIWQGSLKGLLQRFVPVTFIFSVAEVIGVIRHQHETNLIAFGEIN